ncbi:transporter substrate-binding domain-containing protein [Microbacterium sp. 2FI]|uniref:transporter substrate-binding domain-containing protein n=1 Tax=Microbacterium sp. 2FI TaxID=2502193 RepID=UPI0010F46C3D|nr:transporter substrate-binding domain-containing protein [Microbacterium sp. 2FI]
MKLRVAYVEEPPFCSTAEDGSATGADIELADLVLRAIGATSVEFVPTTFGELLAGVDVGRWELNVPIFVTPERAEVVAFSRPVWALVDGLVVKAGNPKGLTSYSAVVEREDALLGVIPGQIQMEAARNAGVPDARLITFADQPSAVAALLSGGIDAFSATALGNRAIAVTHPGLEGVALDSGGGRAPVGAFSVRRSDHRLLRAVDDELHGYIGSDDHRRRMAKYGIGVSEIDGVAG